MYTNKSHFCRAVLESVYFQTRELIDAMQSDSGADITSLMVDGGMVVNNLLCQLQADIAGVNVVRPAITEITALGAAICAGLSCGLWSSLEDAVSHLADDSSRVTFRPKEEKCESERE
eukprot:887251_1